MDEWLHGDSWRYHAVSLVAFVMVATLIVLAFVLLEPDTGGVYAIGIVALLIMHPVAARKHIFWPPQSRWERTLGGPD